MTILTDAAARESRARYDKVLARSRTSAQKAAASLRKRHKPVTAYSIHKEAGRLAAKGVEDVHPVSANTIRNHPEWNLLTNPLERRLFRGADTPKDMERMTRSEAIEQAKIDRAWALANSARVIELEEENARLRLELRELKKLV